MITTKSVIPLGELPVRLMSSCDMSPVPCSHSLGESVYDLQEAQVMRVKLIKLSEEVDILRSVVYCF